MKKEGSQLNYSIQSRDPSVNDEDFDKEEMHQSLIASSSKKVNFQKIPTKQVTNLEAGESVPDMNN
jgi:hypothetical protein